jgi:hypothetical protein
MTMLWNSVDLIDAATGSNDAALAGSAAVSRSTTHA